VPRATWWVIAGAAVVLLWWVSGLDRLAVDPRASFTSEQIARADGYQGPRYVSSVASIVLGLLVLAVLAFSGLGDRLLDPLRRWPWAIGAVAAVGLTVLIRAAVRLPLSFWNGYVHEHTWGFSTQSIPGWLGDWLKGLGIGVAITGVVFVALFGAVRAFPRAWPAVAALAAAGITAVLSFLGPVVLEPVFNRFRPLEDPAQTAELKALAARAGVPVRDVLVSDASRRTTKENAYVSGFGATRRLVLFDTLLEKADPDEVRLVVAHELGHRRARHVEIGTAVGAVGAAAAVVVLWLLFRWGVLPGSPADPRSVPAILLAVTLLTLATAPAANWLSRRFERSADRFSLTLTGEETAYVKAERGLALRNLSDLDPGPVTYRFLYTHPAPAERLALVDR
jgi:STE24 endopeptidase